ncbi:MAG: glycosyltransferase family 4 protein [Planctomycetes bacterium]|nr:glycosyltransferase family 4 protein [Planctomycetota bacterium]
MANLPIHFRGVVLGPSGFAQEGREWLAALEAAGFAASLEGASLGALDAPLPPGDQERVARCAARPRCRGGTTFHHMLIPHAVPDPRAARNVLHTLFETDDLPEEWVPRLRAFDLLVVPSEHQRGVFARAGVAPERLAVLPPPLRTDQAVRGDPERAADPPRPGGARPFRWLSVFDWSLRKGHDVLLRAFARAFRAGEAELVLKVLPGRHAQAALQEHCDGVVRANARGTPPRVQVLQAVVDDRRCDSLYRCADAFVLASRGEGWGRPVHEALLHALPTVTTAGGTLAEVMPPHAGFAVRASRVPVSAEAAAETPCFAGLHWWEPDVEDLAAQMRAVYEDLPAARQRAWRGREHGLWLCERGRIAERLRAILAAVPRAVV